MYCRSVESFANAASSTPPCSWRLFLARSRSWSTVQPDFATPMTGTSSVPRLTMLCRVGKIFLYARSPVAPKNTSASEWTPPSVFSRPQSDLGSGTASALLLDVAAELEPHRGEQLVREVGLAARVEPLVERRGEHVDRGALVDRGEQRPASL